MSPERYTHLLSLVSDKLTKVALRECVSTSERLTITFILRQVAHNKTYHFDFIADAQLSAMFYQTHVMHCILHCRRGTSKCHKLKMNGRI